MKKNTFMPYLIAAGAGLLVAALVALRQGFFKAETATAAYAALCDAFFVPGALMVCFGLFSFIGYGGFFDIFTYGFKSLKRLFTLFGKKDNQHYYEYRQAKAEKREKPKYHTLKVGLVFILIAVIFLLLSEKG